MVYVKGRADIALKLEIIKKTTAFLILVVSIPFGLIGLCIGKAIYGLLAMLLNSIYTKRLIGISILEQVKDFTPYLFMGVFSTLTALIPVYCLNNLYAE